MRVALNEVLGFEFCEIGGRAQKTQPENRNQSEGESASRLPQLLWNCREAKRIREVDPDGSKRIHPAATANDQPPARASQLDPHRTLSCFQPDQCFVSCSVRSLVRRYNLLRCSFKLVFAVHQTARPSSAAGHDRCADCTEGRCRRDYRQRHFDVWKCARECVRLVFRTSILNAGSWVDVIP